MKVHKCQLDSIVDYFQKGATSPSDFAVGVEIEHFIVDSDNAWTPYYGDRGVESILSEIKSKFNKVEYSNGHILGLHRDKLSVTLEPGAQFETALGPFKDASEVKAEYQKFLTEVNPLLERRGLHLVTQGYHPTVHKDDVEIIPKPRYAVMNEYLEASGKYGRNMMRCSASTQVSVDYSSEADAIKKVRVASAIGPILALMFSNAPIFESEKNPFRMLRIEMWDNLDKHRAGEVPNLFDEDFGFQKWAEYILTAPLMVADLSHTPEYDGVAPVQLAEVVSACEVYPNRALNKYEIEHIISTYFFDVRLKNFIELRTVDSLPLDQAIEFAHVVQRALYDIPTLENISKRIEGITNADIRVAKFALEKDGEKAVLYGSPYSEWVELLKI